jgi:hypothetical protein
MICIGRAALLLEKKLDVLKISEEQAVVMAETWESRER